MNPKLRIYTLVEVRHHGLQLFHTSLSIAIGRPISFLCICQLHLHFMHMSVKQSDNFAYIQNINPTIN